MSPLVRFVLLGALPLALLSASPPAIAAVPNQLSLADAERLALDANPALLSVAARVRSSEVAARAGFSRMLPSVFLSEEYQHWNSPFVVGFSPTQMFQARDQNTNTFAASVNQPLLGLLRLVEDYRAQKLGAQATTAQLKVVQAAVRQGMRSAFIRYFEAKALEEIAQQSEKELNEQVVIAQAKLKAGVLTNADVLRVKVAAANSQQQGIVAHTQADIARATILITVGSTPDAAVELVTPTELLQTSRGDSGSYSAVVSQALAARPELLSARLAVEVAEHQQRGRGLSLLPEVNVEGGYARVDGQIFAPANAAFIGIKATWQIWDWGATWFGYRAAREQAAAARQDIAAEQRQIATEVATDLSQSQAARSAVSLAEQSITSAQEAYRVTDALVKAGSATTTDLLESQSALNQARLNLVRAQYQLALAYVAIQHAVGD